jgi:hypothetical protein
MLDDGINWMRVRIDLSFTVDVIADDDDDAEHYAMLSDEALAARKFLDEYGGEFTICEVIER